MKPQLTNLILEYQKAILVAVKIMKRSGVRMPFSRDAWIDYEIPQQIKFEKNIVCYKHGAGCMVVLPTGNVDFDFGKRGEINGFDIWRLIRFADGSLQRYGFADKGELISSFEDAIINKELLTSENDYLYYIANSERFLAINVGCELSGDLLPFRDQDSILTLYSHYFLSAERMLKDYEKTKNNLYKSKTSINNNNIDKRIYMCSWLGYLAVTCEGFRKLKIRLLLSFERPKEFNELIPKVDKIGNIMKLHADSLRKFRNDIFHLRDSTDALYEFFENEAEHLTWSHDLHAILADFFSNYRVFCEVHYIMYGRESESDFLKK